MTRNERVSFLFWYKQILSGRFWLQELEDNRPTTGETEYDQKPIRKLNLKIFSVVGMTLQGRFHFLDLWDETEEEGEFREGDERKESVCMEPSQWANGQPEPGRCVCANTLFHLSLSISPLISLHGLLFFMVSASCPVSKPPAGGSKSQWFERWLVVWFKWLHWFDISFSPSCVFLLFCMMGRSEQPGFIEPTREKETGLR